MPNSFTGWDACFLAHHGIKGQKWGVRRYQNSDGSLTPEGKQHYAVSSGGNSKLARLYSKQKRKQERLEKNTNVGLQRQKAEKYEKRAKIGAAIGTGAAGVGAAAFLGTKAKKILNSGGMSPFERGFRFGMVKEMDRQKWGAKIYPAGMAAALWGPNHFVDRPSYNSLINPLNKKLSGGIGKTIGKAAFGAAAVSYGYAAVNKILASKAKYRTTEAGHKKAVRKYEDQTAKMLLMFADTPYSELIKKKKSDS